MRYVIVIVLALVAIGVFRYLEDRPAQETTIQAPPTPAPTSAPTPLPTFTPTPVAKPELSRVMTFSGRVITGARVMQVRSDGILFKCDQGLVKIQFADLPEIFTAYYSRMVIMDSPQQGAQSQFGAKPVGNIQGGITNNLVPTATQAERKYAYDVQRAVLKARIKDDTETIDRWNKQSSINVTTQQDYGRVTQQGYETAQADLKLATSQLAELEANGP